MTINRAPTLTLWVAAVAQREGYTPEEGLSFGKYISGVFAHSKGEGGRSASGSKLHCHWFRVCNLVPLLLWLVMCHFVTVAAKA